MRSKAALSPGADDDCSAGRPGARIRIPRRLAQFADFWSAKSMTLSSWGHKSPPPAVGYGKQGTAHVRSPTCYRITAFASGLGFASSVRSLRVLQGDSERLCPGVPMGGGRIVGCLKEHKMEVSVGCARAIQHIKAEMGK
jgi:hypothetical protein